MIRMMALALGLALLVTPTKAQTTDENRVSSGDVRMVMQRTVEDVIRPGYLRYMQSAGKLENAITALCQAPSNELLDAVNFEFAQTVKAWAQVEFIRFGPVLSNNRLERVLFWPDRKSTGLKQVQELLATGDESALSAQSLAKKSVAVQGLGALEFILYATGSDAFASGDAFRCSYAKAIAANLYMIGDELVGEWAAGSPASAKWVVGREADAAAATLNELLATMVHGLEAIRDIRIRGFVDIAQGRDKPKLAVFWRSGLTAPSIAANVVGLQTLFEESAMEALLPSEVASIAESIRFEFRETLDVASGVSGPVDRFLADPGQRQRLVLTDLLLGSLISRFDKEFAPASGLAAGFSFADGD